MSGLQLLRVGVLAGQVLHDPTLPEAEWLMSCVATDGAITETPGDVNVRPYMSCYGAIGLVRAYQVTGNPKYINAAKDWVSWYAAHMDGTTGYVNDYTTTTAFTDDFNRSNGPVGNGWSLWYGSSASVLSNRLTGDASGTAVRRDLGTADLDLSFDVIVSPGSFRFEAYLGTLADVGATQTYYLVTLADDGTLSLIRRHAGGDGDLPVVSASVGSPSTARTVRIVMKSNYCTVSVDGSDIFSSAVVARTGTGTALLVASGITLDNVVFASVRADSGAADSTDAYAGMFLIVLYLVYQELAMDTAWLATVTPSIPLALTAIESTQQEDGLTYALPSYTVKYLEDNIEALAGLQAALNLTYGIGDTTNYTRASVDADRMARGLGNLWNFENGTFDYALHENNVFTRNDWADENSQRQQIWALGWGIEPPGSGAADALLDAYLAALPGWSTQNAPGYEVLPAWAENNLGRATDANAGIANLEASITGSAHAYPWTCATSGQLIIAKYGRFNLLMPAVTFPSGAVNLMPNPAFYADSNGDGTADGVSNYGSPTMSLIPTDPSPTNIQQMVTPGGNDMRWDPIAVTGGQFYVQSVYRKIVSIDPGTTAVLKYEFLRSDDSFAGYGYAETAAGVADGDFVRWWNSIWVPADVTQIRCVVGTGGSGGATIQVKNVKLETAGSSPTPFTSPPFLTVVDHFADLGQDITAASGSLTWDNTGFDAASETTLSPVVGHDGWVYLFPTNNCTATFSTVGSGPNNVGGNTDTHIRVYEQMDALYGSFGGLLFIAEDDDSGGAHGSGSDSGNSWVQVNLLAGHGYAVQVGMHYTAAPSTHMVLNWSGLDFTTVGDSHPRNDLLQQEGFNLPNVLTISGAGQDPPFPNWDYTSEPFETGAHMYRSAWYTFVPTADGTATLDTSLVQVTGHALAADGSFASTDTYIRLYTGPDGATFTDLAQVASDDDSGGPGGQSNLSYGVTAGQRYYVQASMYRDTYWNDQFALRWNIP